MRNRQTIESDRINAWNHRVKEIEAAIDAKLDAEWYEGVDSLTITIEGTAPDFVMKHLHQMYAENGWNVDFKSEFHRNEDYITIVIKALP